MTHPTADGPPALAHLCDLRVQVAVPIEAGEDARGRHRIIPITGGTVSGARLSGRVLNLGADWQCLGPDLAAVLDTRYAIETDDGALIDVRNFGHRHGPRPVMEALMRGETPEASLIYFRTNPRFETRDPRYDWLNRTIFIGTGLREPDCVVLRFWEVL
ncbi:DUF3237 domain-containing protein [Oceanicella sp. SM1341]|uniref:DUF3237 domain-containing protein n=1 Tax=Oceanicella sp. SM1341 TaxID=1548889 RepID=UPI000E547ABD|nr:DUF3237 domain-containing protein [Oceanicella sp. SM1341]